MNDEWLEAAGRDLATVIGRVPASVVSSAITTMIRMAPSCGRPQVTHGDGAVRLDYQDRRITFSLNDEGVVTITEPKEVEW